MTDQLKLSDLRQAWPKPSNPMPIIMFGAGSIVTDAHLPAYRNGGFPVRGIYDPDLEKAQKVAQEWGIIAYSNIEEAIAQEDVLFDLATPPQAHFGILEKLPDGAVALLQKPMGNDLDQASKIVSICESKNIRAAVNFQLRFSPMMLALKDAADKGLLGDIVDFDAWLALDTPWHLWEFLLKSPRVELSLHSIHYLDFIRSLLGNPHGIHAKTMGHPSSEIAQTRTSAILDYDDEIRCALSINHNHSFGRQFQACEFRICGTKGAAYVKLGVNLDYPHGEPDELWLNGGDGWQQVPLHGTWFPDAFTHRMEQIQRYATGEEEQLISNVQDGWDTMALVEAAYLSNSLPSTPIAKRD